MPPRRSPAAERANRGAGAFRRKRRDPQRLPAGGFRVAGKILHHDADARNWHRGPRQQFGPARHRRKPVGQIRNTGREQADGIERPRKTFHATVGSSR